MLLVPPLDLTSLRREEKTLNHYELRYCNYSKGHAVYSTPF